MMIRKEIEGNYGEVAENIFITLKDALHIMNWMIHGFLKRVLGWVNDENMDGKCFE